MFFILVIFFKDKCLVEGMVSLEVVELMFDMLGKFNGFLWIFFDVWGVLIIWVLCRGWLVNLV